LRRKPQTAPATRTLAVGGCGGFFAYHRDFVIGERQRQKSIAKVQIGQALVRIEPADCEPIGQYLEGECSDVIVIHAYILTPSFGFRLEGYEAMPTLPPGALYEVRNQRFEV